MSIVEQVSCDRCRKLVLGGEYVKLMQMGTGKQVRLRDAKPGYMLEFCIPCVAKLREWLSRGDDEL